MPACDKATFIMLHNAIPPSFHSSGSETSERARGGSSLFKLLHMCTSPPSLPPSLPPSGLVPHYHNVSKSRTPRTAALLVPLQPKSDLSGARERERDHASALGSFSLRRTGLNLGSLLGKTILPDRRGVTTWGPTHAVFCRPNMFERSGVGKVGKWVRSAVSDPMVTFHFWEE